VTGKLSPRTTERLVELGEHIRAARKEQGISRAKLAELIEMHPGNYARIERGKKNLTIDTLLRIAEGLSMDLTVVFDRRPSRKRTRD
jgi:XRE family transcriptional regulator, regulator of sulfur utilization